MTLRDRSALKQAAATQLARADYDPKKLTLLHTGAVLAVSLILSVLHHLLQLQISDTGGLSGMGTRSILSTAQTMLQLAQMIILPFWQFGYTFAAIRIFRQASATPDSLLEGFRRFGPLLRLMLLEAMLVFGVTIGASYLASFLFCMTPWGMEMMNVVTEAGAEVTDVQILQIMMDYAAPLLILFTLILLVFAVPMFYRLRLAPYLLLDTPLKSAIAAMQVSRQVMRGRCLDLLKLDLSFWWFYALDLLVGVVAYSDTILSLMGITLPVDPALAFFGALVLYSLCQLALYCRFRPQVEVTYVAAYAALVQLPEEQPEQPKNQPWNY